IVWPRRRDEDEPFEPATLIVACDGAAALQIQHETFEVIARINAFLGYPAIGRIKIVQRSVAAGAKPKKPPLRPLKPGEKAKLDRLAAAIENDDLRASLSRLGASIIARKT